ncbi:MAG TPA: YraN family protein [Candidatus Paceibacterota bacterium]|nr:YraN family protein [Candidatus Paceibacterota bacterium]
MHKSKTSRTGSLGEDIASQFLTGRGFAIVERNFRKPWGEIDLIAEKDGIIHFVEVKAVSRALDQDGSYEIDYRPEEMVTRSKLHKVVRTATLYMESHNDRREFQIDVLGVVMDPEKRVARCRLFEQVLE